MRISIAAVAAATLLSSAPLAASAQPVPSYASLAAPGDGQIRGRIASFDGSYALRVRDERGYLDNVRLHPGTIINPTGLTLAPGMVVGILGYDNGSYFAANEVDTPYTYYGGLPYYDGHPWNYWGPAVSLGFFFGNTGWWHGGGFAGGYHYYNGVRIYGGVHVNRFYNGGTFHGRDYVAPVARGGYVPHGGFAHGGFAHGSSHAFGFAHGGGGAHRH
jgi:hypothetical protein